MTEIIICAAIWYNDGIDSYVHQPKNITTGYVVCGHRHHNCFTIKAMLSGLPKGQNTYSITQGFLTNTNKFVDRIEAGKIALASGQIDHLRYGKELYSEDLY